MISIIGTLYAVLLGLVIVDAQGRYQQAQLMEASEANAAADLFVLTAALPPTNKGVLQHLLKQYVDAVLDEEWPAMDKLSDTMQPTIRPLHSIWDEVALYEPVTNREQACYGSMLQQLGQLSDSRRFRVVVANSGIPPVLWAVLIVGAILTVAFTYFFGVENFRAQTMMTAIVSLTLALNILLVAFFGNPYQGDLKIKPTSFQYDRGMFKRYMPGEP